MSDPLRAATTPPDLRERLDEIVVRVLAAQQAFAMAMYSDDPLPEPQSEDVVDEILAVLTTLRDPG